MNSEVRNIRNEKAIISFSFTDFTDSITSKIFIKQSEVEDYEGSLKKGNYIEIKGIAVYDSYIREISINSVVGIRKIQSFETFRMDDSEEKRVELHAHSKMSTMDGVCTVDSYFKQASKWGHKALAITDHENVQAFPEVQEASKKYGVKALYGCEMNMIDDQLEYIYNPSEVELHNATYVVFDFETTGLSARYDRIIEFGAVKFKDGLVVDSMDFFVDPEIPISKFIQEKTKITNAMVRGQKGIKEALRLMMK
jgi:DNA polymerase-3 subunit alpha (Gram-positive type)